MFQFPRLPPPGLCVQPGVMAHDRHRVAPFGNPGISLFDDSSWLIAVKPRPSSARSAKASTVRRSHLTCAAPRAAPVAGCRSALPRPSGNWAEHWQRRLHAFVRTTHVPSVLAVSGCPPAGDGEFSRSPPDVVAARPVTAGRGDAVDASQLCPLSRRILPVLVPARCGAGGGRGANSNLRHRRRALSTSGLQTGEMGDSSFRT